MEKLPEPIKSATRMPGEFDLRKHSHSAKVERRSQIKF